MLGFAKITRDVTAHFEKRVKFESGKTVEEAKQKMEEATAQLNHFNDEMGKYSAKSCAAR